MARHFALLINRLIHRRMLRRWTRIADAADSMPLADLRTARSRARQTRRQVERVMHHADTRLALAAATAASPPRPKGADWAWRPMPWLAPLAVQGLIGFPSPSQFADAVSIHHDCADSELALRQIANTGANIRCPFAISLDVFGFDGSFLSLAIDLPPDAAQGLKLRHLIRLELQLETERPVKTYARLNVRHGPNSEQILRELPGQDTLAIIDFDLANSPIDERRIGHLWLDLIFDAPRMNRITLRDLTFSRRPRAGV